MAQRTEIAYVLAGGQSRRMGTDKLSLMIGGASLLERTTAVCAASFGLVKLVAPTAGKLSELGYPVVLDSPTAAGPMAGIIAVLEDCPTESCFVTAADLFDLSTEVIELLVSRYRGQDYIGLKEERGVQPLCGIYNVAALAVLQSRAEKGSYGMSDALQDMRIGSVEIPPGQWRNLNRPEDLATLEGYHG